MAKKALIVDDMLFMRVKLKGLLENLGLQVVGEGANGIEAVAKYKELQPDVVFMDITMPELDGIAALRQIKAYDPQALVVMVSAMGQERIVMDAILAGAKSFVVKPFQDAKLQEIIEGLAWR